VNMKFNVFYSTFTNVFLFLSRFLRFLTFFILISTFFTSMTSIATFVRVSRNVGFTSVLAYDSAMHTFPGVLRVLALVGHAPA